MRAVVCSLENNIGDNNICIGKNISDLLFKNEPCIGKNVLLIRYPIYNADRIIQLKITNVSENDISKVSISTGMKLQLELDADIVNIIKPKEEIFYV